MLSKLASISAWRCASCRSMPGVTEITVIGGSCRQVNANRILTPSNSFEVINICPKGCVIKNGDSMPSTWHMLEAFGAHVQHVNACKESPLSFMVFDSSASWHVTHSH